MDDKDPKDMTASELLRLAAGEGEQGNWVSTVRKLAHLVGISDLRICELNNCDLLDESYKIIADKIDAELAQARTEGIEASLRAGAELWAKANGWPDFKQGEDFGAWLDRCAIPRPRYEDGEPVQFGDDTDKLDGVEQFIFLRSGGGCCQMQDADGNINTVFPGERVKRPAPEALGADGLPVKVGETVWDVESGIEGVVDNFQCIYGQSVTANIKCPDDGEFYNFNVDRITHTPPDTQEKIDEDAVLDAYKYWGCVAIGNCENCPAKVDGDKPYKRYQADDCTQAMMFDLLRRQRELDKRTGGAE